MLIRLLVIQRQNTHKHKPIFFPNFPFFAKFRKPAIITGPISAWVLMWRLLHLMAFILSGVGLLFQEHVVIGRETYARLQDIFDARALTEKRVYKLCPFGDEGGLE